MPEVYDIGIVGAGPAGLTASIYTSRYNLKTIAFGTQKGGLVTDAHEVCNFPGYPRIKGSKLGESFIKHAEKYGARIKQEKINKINKNKKYFVLGTNLGNHYNAKKLLFALGSKRRKLNLKNEEKFLGSGVSYCATCDGRFFKDKKAAVVGGANAAATAALYLADLAKQVYLIYRKSQLRCVPAWRKEVENTSNIEIIYNTNVTSLQGDTTLKAIGLDNQYQDKKILNIDGLFIEIGSIPETELTQELGVTTDPKGYIKIDKFGQTNQENIWAAGDVTTGSTKFKQVITAAAEGAIAANDIYQNIRGDRS